MYSQAFLEVRGVQVHTVFAAVIDLDVTYFFQLVLFLVFVVAINGLLFKPLLALLERRKAETEEREREALEGLKEAEELMSKYNREVAQARAEGMAVRNRARDQALRLESDRLTAARAASTRWLDGEVARFSGEIDEARVQARSEVETMAGDIVGILSSAAQAPGKEVP
jgi:F-type H+-transporting ATPase subunit b